MKKNNGKRIEETIFWVNNILFWTEKSKEKLMTSLFTFLERNTHYFGIEMQFTRILGQNSVVIFSVFIWWQKIRIWIFGKIFVIKSFWTDFTRNFISFDLIGIGNDAISLCLYIGKSKTVDANTIYSTFIRSSQVYITLFQSRTQTYNVRNSAFVYIHRKIHNGFD